MLNTQHTTSYYPNTDNLLANQTITPDNTYLSIVQQCKTTAEIKSFCERLIAIHNINSTAEYKININNNSRVNELHPKFNAWVIKVFHNVTIDEIANIALLFDIFEEYKSNMQEEPQNIKIRVIKKLFSKYGKNITLEQLRNNVYKFLIDKRNFSNIKSMLIATPDIEQITTHGNMVNFNCKHLDIVCLLNEELSDNAIKDLLFLLDISDSQNENNTINRFDNINKIMVAINTNYPDLVSLISEYLYKPLLASKLTDIISIIV
jgi:hypothetical protein